MKFPDFTKMDIQKLSVWEILLFLTFILYLILDVSIPVEIGQMIGSPLGLLGIFAGILSLFVYINPILGVLAVFVTYELLRRISSPMMSSSSSTYYDDLPLVYKNNIPTYIPVADKNPVQVVANQITHVVENKTLEEEVIGNMVPVQYTTMNGIKEQYQGAGGEAGSMSSYKPVIHKVEGALV